MAENYENNWWKTNAVALLAIFITILSVAYWGVIKGNDGDIYPTVKIGTQVWTAKNWKCQHYNDGTPIPLIEDNAQWAALTTGAQCVYNNDISNL